MPRVLLIGAAVSAICVPVADAHFKKHGRYCGVVVTTPNTDDGASAIRATHTTCRTARRIARRYEAGNRSPLGWECVSRGHDGAELGHRDVVCFRGERRVTFAAY